MIAKNQIPNLITILRGVLILVIVVLFLLDVSDKWLWSYPLFLMASATDFIDGYLARKWNVVSEFGALFDPLFDKVLTLSMFMLFIPEAILPVGIFVLFLIRELLVDGIKSFVATKGKVIHAIKTAKWKMIMQIVFLNVCFWMMLWPSLPYLTEILYATTAIALGLAWWSGAVYTRLFTKTLSS